MFVTVKSAVVVIVPAIASLFGIFWLQRKRQKQPASSENASGNGVGTSDNDVGLGCVEQSSETASSCKLSEVDSLISQSSENPSPSSFTESENSPEMISSIELCDCADCRSPDKSLPIHRFNDSLDDFVHCLMMVNSPRKVAGDFDISTYRSDNLQDDCSFEGYTGTSLSVETSDQADCLALNSSVVDIAESRVRIMPCLGDAVCEPVANNDEKKLADIEIPVGKEETAEKSQISELEEKPDLVDQQSVCPLENTAEISADDEPAEFQNSSQPDEVPTFTAAEEPAHEDAEVEKSAIAPENTAEEMQYNTHVSDDQVVSYEQTEATESSLNENGMLYNESWGENAEDVAPCADETELAAVDSDTCSYLPENVTYVRQFEMHANLSGLLIGRRGRTIRWISDKSQTTIVVKPHPTKRNAKVVFIRGFSGQDVEEAYALISDMFPKETLEWPEYTYTPTFQQENLTPLHNSEVTIVSIVEPRHVFVQLPEQFAEVGRLTDAMNFYYMYKLGCAVENTVSVGALYATPLNGSWFRCQVTELHADGESCVIKLVDVGGYAAAKINFLKKLRDDFSSLPFQAIECYMSNIQPPNGEAYFPYDAVTYLESMTRGTQLLCSVQSFAEDNTPFVSLYARYPDMMVNINQSLIAEGYATSC